ncbi:MAG TPA: metalloregulator ArsR/SmtB family transcription factor [Longimicrobiales bacterium]
MEDIAEPQDMVAALSALADEKRLRIVELLAGGRELSCGAIGAALGLSASLVSHHLAVLESAGIIDRRKSGPCTLNRLRCDELSRRLSVLERLVCAG